MIDKVGIQTFTIRNDMQNLVEMEKTLRFYAGMGIKKFELSRINFYKEDLNVLKRLQAELGLEYTASQITMKKIIKKFDFLMEFSNVLGIKYLEVSVIPIMFFIKKEAGIIEMSGKLNELGRRSSKYGINLLYHHHDYELIHFDKQLSLDLLLSNTDKEYVNLVCDTYWLAKSGYNPAKFIEDRMQRVRGVHLRDNILEYKRGKFITKDTAIGNGTIDFSAVIKLDKLNMIDFYSIEQDTNQPKKDILQSYNYLKSLAK